MLFSSNMADIRQQLFQCGAIPCSTGKLDTKDGQVIVKNASHHCVALAPNRDGDLAPASPRAAA
jgi:hypothetical protein